ncbi:MAG: hypothetical protein U0X92_12545 [Anaerolineales bacterium]
MYLANNKQLADTFTLIANLLEIKGEIIYKTLAYRKASEQSISLPREASEFWKEGKLLEIPGRGQSHRRKNDELLKTGSFEFLENKKKSPEEFSPRGWLSCRLGLERSP